jgi:hypothetical protein
VIHRLREYGHRANHRGASREQKRFHLKIFRRT